MSEVVYSAKKFNVIRLPPPTPGAQPHEIVQHPGAVVILPILPDGRIVMIHNLRPAVQRELLELPAGTLEPTEPPIECARRELAEETGYRAGRLWPLLTFFTSPGICTELMHAFLADELVPGPPALEEGEHIRTTLVSWDELLTAIAAGRVQDGKTLATVLHYDRFRRRGEQGAR